MRRTCKRKHRWGRFFLLPNEIFTLGLTPGELSVYTYLMFCEDRETHQCWPSIGKICQHTGMSANTVAKYIRQLEERQLIKWNPPRCVPSQARCETAPCSSPSGPSKKLSTTTWNASWRGCHRESLERKNGEI